MPLVFRPNRQGFQLRTTRLSLSGGVLTKESRVSFTYNRARFTERFARKTLRALLQQGGKVGFLIGRAQRIKGLEVAGMKLTPSAQVSREFQQSFGAGPGEKWVGFPTAGKPVLLGLGFETKLKITFKPRAKASFQLVPVVLAFGSQDLTRHYVLGVSALTPGKPMVDSFVEVISAK
ncbi:MAG: hypothetical protein HYY95_19670 [Candidatus Rokubacteria bacterium]|nr:hypothetical protein [Candidatus Rokubacteria bacterium]